MTTAGRTALDGTSPERVWWRSERAWWNAPWAQEHRPFLIALALGTLIRVVVSVAFTPALIYSDSPTYLDLVDKLRPRADRPVGYDLLLLDPLSWLSRDVILVPVAQHLMGLATAVLLYLLLRRWGVSARVATLATLPVLFDTLQLVLEQTVLSDVLFDLLLVMGVVLLAWRRRPTPTAAAVAGLLLGLSATVRLVGEPLIVMGVVFCLLTGGDWRRRLAGATAFTVGFLVPLGAYATWYHQEHGTFAISQFTGKSLYMRSTTFVLCPKLSIPKYQRVLCPGQPPSQRSDPTYYGWHDPFTLPRLQPPPGTSADQAMRDFALQAVREQPLDYLRDASRDFLLNFDLWRGDRYQYDTAHKWMFSTYLHPQPTDWTRPAYRKHGGDQLSANQPFAGLMAKYQWVGYLPGPVLLACLVLGMLGALGVRRARTSGLRSRCLLLTITGAGLMLVPDLTAEFVWRYQLPAVVLIPAGAALAYTALRGPSSRLTEVPSSAGDRDPGDPEN